jgi:hypothetical protein
MLFTTNEKQQDKVYRVKIARKPIMPPHTNQISHRELDELPDLFIGFFIYSQICINTKCRSPLGQRESGLIRHW